LDYISIIMDDKFQALENDMSNLSSTLQPRLSIPQVMNTGKLTSPIEAEIEERLAQAPKATIDDFSAWQVKTSTAKVTKELSAPPLSDGDVSKKISTTDFQDPVSVLNLYLTISNIVPPAPLPLGKLTAPDSKAYFYSLHFDPNAVPNEIPEDETRLDTCLTHLKRTPEPQSGSTDPVATLPALSFALGKLKFTEKQDADADSAVDTNFTVLVNVADKKAWALWNNAADNATPRTGRLPGFSKECLAFPFEGTTVDALLPGAGTTPKTLTVDASKFVTPPSTTKIEVGGVDAKGWEQLVKTSQKYADAAKK
jgi:hypothetical protein